MATDISFTPFRPGTSQADGQRIAVIDQRLRRTNYFDGQLLKASDLTRDQIYLDERLLELGQALGSGIVRGLGLRRPQPQVLRIAPGIAVAPSGRVLELSDAALDIDLADAARLATLNDGRIQRLPRGLYLLALARAEVIDGVAEAFPRDLASARVPRVASYAEGVQLVLYRLPVALPRQDELAVRAALARELLGGNDRLALPDDDAVALALLAVDNARLQWLDQGLVRRPRRSPGQAGALQQDLATHYRELMAAVRSSRAAQGLAEAFEARQVFRVLPPHGPCPKAAFDPVAGSQRFFPEAWEVSIAPVRRSDLPVLLADAELLAPIDLQQDADIDLMVLVPLPDNAYAVRARQLEAPPEAAPADRRGKLARLDRLALRISPLQPVHRVDSDDKVWAAIWAEAAPDELVYVRRPPRAAETGVSALVLAAGARLPPLGEGLPPDTAALEAELDTAVEQVERGERALLAQQHARDAALAQIKTLEATIEKQREALAAGGDGRLAEALASVAALQAQLAAARAELERLASGERNAAILATAQAAMAAQIDGLKAEVEASTRLIEKLKSQLASSDGNPDALRAQVEALTAELDAARTGLAELTAKLDSAEVQRSEADGQVRALTAQNAELAEALAKARDATGDNGTALDEALARVTQQDADLARARADLQARTSELATLSVRATQLRADYDDAVAQLKRLEAGTALDVDLGKELSLPLLALLRGGDRGAATQLDKTVGKDPALRLAVVRLLAVSPAINDALLWDSLLQVATQPAALLKLEPLLQDRVRNKQPLARAMAELGGDFELGDDLVKRWRELAG